MVAPIILAAGVALAKELLPRLLDLADRHTAGKITDQEFWTQWHDVGEQIETANVAWEKATQKDS